MAGQKNGAVYQYGTKMSPYHVNGVHNVNEQYIVTAHVDGLVQVCSISSSLAMELLQSCIRPWMSWVVLYIWTSWY